MTSVKIKLNLLNTKELHPIKERFDETEDVPTEFSTVAQTARESANDNWRRSKENNANRDKSKTGNASI